MASCIVKTHPQCRCVFNYKVKNRCPDYDEDCKTMSIIHANWCFMGCQNKKCLPIPNSLGIAEGYCPIIHNSN